MRISDWSSDVCSSDLALSVTMPLREAPWVGAVARNWFCNLLPEGAVRQAIVERLRIAPDDDFALLAAIGGECAGAVSLRVPGVAPDTADDGETDLETLLALQGDDGGEGSWALAGMPMRPSLRSEEHTSELQSLMRISYAVFCLKKKSKIHKCSE